MLRHVNDIIYTYQTYLQYDYKHYLRYKIRNRLGIRHDMNDNVLNHLQLSSTVVVSIGFCYGGCPLKGEAGCRILVMSPSVSHPALTPKPDWIT